MIGAVKRAAVAAGGAWVASVLWAAYTLTRKGVRVDLDHKFFFTPYELGIPFQDVGFRNRQGLQLRGWWLDRPATRKVIIICSGYGRNKSDLLGIGSHLWRAGYNVFVFDFRDQGESDAAISTIGHYESDDLQAAIDCALLRLPDAEIGLVGYSMGAAASIMAASRRQEVRAVVSDSAFADLGRILTTAFRRATHLPPRPAVDLAELLVWLKAGYRFSRVRPVDYIGRLAPRPVLIIHGDRDDIAPVSDAYELYNAAREPKELWISHDCAHCGTYFLDRQVYVDRIVRFITSAMGDPAQEFAERVDRGAHMADQQAAR